MGHSMGGLVARSALHQAGGGTPERSPWARLVRDTVTLGTPHLGAPLERGVHALTARLARVPETRPLAALLAPRSAGIKDLRRGTLVEEDWTGRDLDAAGPAAHTAVPLSTARGTSSSSPPSPATPTGRWATCSGTSRAAAQRPR